MRTPHYRFGRFRLDPHSRELLEDGRRIELPISAIDCLAYLISHRDRPVGRDELAAAVWGRADVSEVSLTHSIMRLRRVLGDSGDEQRMIRTVPRLGYRWVLDDTIEDDSGSSEPSSPVSDAAPVAQTTPRSGRPRRRTLLGVAAAVAILAVVYLLARSPWSSRHDAAAPPALVLPVKVDVPGDAAWVRLGIMDLIATRLRRAGIATAPSETVVAMVNAGKPASALADAATLVVQPDASLADGHWSVHLAAGDASRTLDAVGRADDPLRAARAATDELLIRLGRAPPRDDPDDAALAAATLRQRVNAAVLSGQLDLARTLIRDAPPASKSGPEIALSEAKIDFYAGEYAKTRDEAEAVLKRMDDNTRPALRAHAMNLAAAALFRLGRIDEAGSVYSESVRYAERANDAAALANAYIGRGGVASQHGRADEAAADYGRARTLLAASNDVFGVAAVDLNLGMNALQRGEPAAARETLRRARTRFERLAAEDALAATLVATVEADLALLDHDDARMLSGQLESLESRGGGQRPRWDLTVARARVLAATGQLSAADVLLARVADASDPAQDRVARAQGDAIAADIALARGDCAKAAALAGGALDAPLESHDAAQYAAAWRTRIDALACGGDAAAAENEAARLESWSADRADPRVRALGDLVAAERSTGDSALPRFAAAMQSATRSGVPDAEVEAGLAYVRRLVAAGRVDEAAAISGRIAPWADRDARAATAEALVYSAMGDRQASARAGERARRLAGERPVVLGNVAAARDGG